MLETSNAYTEYFVALDMKVLNVWHSVLDTTDLFIFSYVKNKFESRNQTLTARKKNNLYPIYLDHLQQAFPVIKLQTRTLRERIKKMCDNGLLVKEKHYVNNSPVIFCGITQYFYDAQELALSNTNFEEIKSKLFPNGYLPTEVATIEINRDENGQFKVSTAKIRRTGNESQRQEPAVQYGENPPYIINPMNLDINKGDNTINYNNTSDLVDNSAVDQVPPAFFECKSEKKGLFLSIWEYGYYLYSGFQLLPAVKDKIKHLVSENHNPENILKVCKEYLDWKKGKLNIEYVIGMEFVYFLEETLGEPLRTKYEPEICPACGREISKSRGICSMCGFDISQTDDWKEEHVSEYREWKGIVV